MGSVDPTTTQDKGFQCWDRCCLRVERLMGHRCPYLGRCFLRDGWPNKSCQRDWSKPGRRTGGQRTMLSTSPQTLTRYDVACKDFSLFPRGISSTTTPRFTGFRPFRRVGLGYRLIYAEFPVLSLGNIRFPALVATTGKGEGGGGRRVTSGCMLQVSLGLSRASPARYIKRARRPIGS